MEDKVHKLVTVYITNYNYAAYIGQSIESVLSQTLQDFELLIIDDGSTDNSREIIESYQGNPKIKIIFQQNKGLNVTNNIAMRASQGKYIMRLDADDYLDANALLVLSNALERDESLGLVFPDYFLVDSGGNILNVERRNSFQNQDLLLDMPAHGACTMIRKAYLEEVGGYDEEFGCQDGYELWIKFTSRFKVENVSTPLFYYRQHGKNLTTNENRILGTRARITEKFIESNQVSLHSTIAIIPVRGLKLNAKDISLKEVAGKPILLGKVDEALKSKNIRGVVVTSPDEAIGQLLRQHFPHEHRVIFHHRSEKLAQLNIGLAETIESVLEKDDVKKIQPENILVLSAEYPFSDAHDFDNAINTLTIFGTDSLISVRKDNNVYYQHHGNGMYAIMGMDKFTKLEREILYQYAGGIIAVRATAFRQTRQLITGTVGHIVVSQKSSFRIQTDFDLQMANRMADL